MKHEFFTLHTTFSQRRGRTGPALGHHRGRRLRCRGSRGRAVRPWCQKTRANQALAGNARENLARVLGIAGGIFDTARWPGAVNAQATCEVRHIAQVLDWALGNYHGANGLTVDKRVALVADVRAKLVPHAQQRISGVRGRIPPSPPPRPPSTLLSRAIGSQL